jgi:hypothetical protein
MHGNQPRTTATESSGSSALLSGVRFGSIKRGGRFWWREKLWERDRHCFAERVDLIGTGGPRAIHFDRGLNVIPAT